MYLSDRLPKQNYNRYSNVDEQQTSLVGLPLEYNSATHRTSKKNLLSPPKLAQQLQPLKELRLPSISNVKQQQYMNQINLGGANGISGLVTSVTRSYASPSIQELDASTAQRAGRKATKKREDEETVTFRSNSNMNAEHHERQSHHLS